MMRHKYLRPIEAFPCSMMTLDPEIIPPLSVAPEVTPRTPRIHKDSPSRRSEKGVVKTQPKKQKVKKEKEVTIEELTKKLQKIKGSLQTPCVAVTTSPQTAMGNERDASLPSLQLHNYQRVSDQPTEHFSKSKSSEFLKVPGFIPPIYTNDESPCLINKFKVQVCVQFPEVDGDIQDGRSSAGTQYSTVKSLNEDDGIQCHSITSQRRASNPQDNWKECFMDPHTKNHADVLKELSPILSHHDLVGKSLGSPRIALRQGNWKPIDVANTEDETEDLSRYRTFNRTPLPTDSDEDDMI